MSSATSASQALPKKPLLLLILDGWGHREEAKDNAISAAHCPNWRRLWQTRPHALIKTDGLAVGLPEGQMGNSEVGHMNLGAGRIVYQDLTRIDLDIANHTFGQNPALRQACEAAIKNNSRLHLMGLLSDGGVHSHELHIHAMLRLAHSMGVSDIVVHAFLDGRDTPPKSAELYLQRLTSVINELNAHRAEAKRIGIATLSGRYFAMDRDKRWERVQLAYQAIAHAQAGFQADTAEQALVGAYARGETDEFVKPTVLGAGAKVANHDVMVFMNFRADRARELSQCFVEANFSAFAIAERPQLSSFVSLTEYAADLAVTAVAYAPQSLTQTLPEILAAHQRTQLRIAETEKYAHVTFFFNGGSETPLPGEERLLIPSPKVATYDLQPEMSCPELTDQLCAAIESARFDVIVCNIANPDMVGHTGVFAAAVKAVEAVDLALGRIEQSILRMQGQMLITADHGNLEDMWDEATNQPNTQHSMNLVPLVLLGSEQALRSQGALQDIAPTMLQLLGLPQPAVMTGKSMLVN